MYTAFGLYILHVFVDTIPLPGRRDPAPSTTTTTTTTTTTIKRTTKPMTLHCIMVTTDKPFIVSTIEGKPDLFLKV